MVWTFLTAFCICGVFGFELWPMTGWRLFADTRNQRHISWDAEAEYTDGSVSPFTPKTAGSTDTAFLVGRLSDLTQTDRNNICKQWLALVTDERQIQRILIHRVTSDLGIRVDNRGAPPTRQLEYVCRNGTVSKVGT